MVAIGAVETAEAWVLTTTEGTLTISGALTDATSLTVTINGEPATVEVGAFHKTVTLSPGINLFTIEIRDAAGNTTTQTLRVTYQPAVAPPEEPPPVAPEPEWPIFVGSLVFFAVVLVLVTYIYMKPRKKK
jgi:hypothetical protein